MGATYKPLKIYKASAGSGKTYALAKEYVKILIRNPAAYRQILAITFTKKATAEMKSRILRFLSTLRDGQDSQLRDAIVREIREEHGYDPGKKLEANAGEALSRILHDYAHFQVTTIDSFFQHIIRSFARELQLPIGMAVELDTDKVLEKCVDALLEDYQKDGKGLSAWLEDFAFSKMDEAKGWRIERNLFEMSRELVKEHYAELQATAAGKPELKNYESLLKAMKEQVRVYGDSIRKKVQEAREGIENNSIDLSFYSRDSVRSFLRKAESLTFESITTIQKMIDGESAAVPKTKVKDDPHEGGRMEQYWDAVLRNQCADILQYDAEHRRDYNTAKHVLRHLYALALMDLLADKLKTYREEENTLLISDANQIISRIADEETSPFIFEKTGTFLRYLLIDEFQDTSQLQWRGLLPMVLEIVSQGTGLSLIVGDPKQSIYRWRGGKMELLLKQIDADLGRFSALKQEVALNTNYRSAANIIRFNNAFFETLKTTRETPVPLFDLAYREHEQQAASDRAGRIDIRWLEQEKGEEDIMLTESLAILREAGSRRPWKDISILVRSNREGIKLAHFLTNEAPDIPFVSGESLLVSSALPVKVIIAAMEYITFPKERFYREKLNYLYAQLFELAAPEAVLQRATSFYLPAMFDPAHPDFSNWQRLTLDELLPALIRDLKLGNHTDAYLLRLQDIVYDFGREQELSVAAFLEHWNEQQQKYAILPPEARDAVTISTIHKAKGLEYPVVLVPFLDWSLTPKTNSLFWGKGHEELSDHITHFPLYYQKELAETIFAEDFEQETSLGYVDIMNVLYVAFTRPREELYALCRRARTENANNLSVLIRQVLEKTELPGAVLEDDHFVYGEIPVVELAAETPPSPGIAPTALRDFRSALSLKGSEVWNASVWEGDVLHELLAGLGQPDDLQKSARLVSLKYGLTESQAAQQVQKAEQVLAFFQSKQWLGDMYNNFHERPIIYKGKELRPDKVLYNEEACIIIDYKTGEPDAKHKQQLEEYREAYSALLRVPVKACLLYTKTMELQEI